MTNMWTWMLFGAVAGSFDPSPAVPVSNLQTDSGSESDQESAELAAPVVKGFAHRRRPQHVFHDTFHLRDTDARNVNPMQDTAAGLIHMRHNSAELLASASDCKLPESARWCSLNGITMACEQNDDIVCNSICGTGDWENTKRVGSLFDEFKGQTMLDIGANVGTFSFVAAHHGMNVEAFEPMPRNLELIEATLCANPDFASRINLHKVALGDTPGITCKVKSGKTNVGDGLMCCPAEENKCDDPGPEYEWRADVQTDTLQSVLTTRASEGMLPVAYVKMDVEGFECKVMKGSPEFLAKFHPKFVQTEVWKTLQGCTPDEFLAMFTDAGYSTAHSWYSKDSHDTSMTGNINEFFMMAEGVTTSVSLAQKIKEIVHGEASIRPVGLAAKAADAVEVSHGAVADGVPSCALNDGDSAFSELLKKAAIQREPDTEGNGPYPLQRVAQSAIPEVYSHLKIPLSPGIVALMNRCLGCVLTETVSVFKKLGMRYFLTGGALVGASRDGKLVPWDDDIDLRLHPEDMSKMAEYLKDKKNADGKYVVGDIRFDNRAGTEPGLQAFCIREECQNPTLWLENDQFPHQDIVDASYEDHVWTNEEEYFQEPLRECTITTADGNFETVVSVPSVAMTKAVLTKRYDDWKTPTASLQGNIRAVDMVADVIGSGRGSE